MSETIYRGYTWSRRLLVTNQIDGQPYPLDGLTIVFRLRRRSTDVDPAIQLAIGTGITLVAGQVGACDVTLTAGQTASLDVDSYLAAAIVTINGQDSVVLPPYRQLVREMP